MMKRKERRIIQPPDPVTPAL